MTIVGPNIINQEHLGMHGYFGAGVEGMHQQSHVPLYEFTGMDATEKKSDSASKQGAAIFSFINYAERYITQYYTI
jgi:hypothetical protein